MDRLQRAASVAARWCAIGLGFSIPISVALDNILVIGFIVCWLASGDLAGKARAMLAQPVAVMALAFAALMAVGMLWSPVPLLDLRESTADTLRFALLAAFATVFLDPDTRRRAQTVFLAASAFILLLSFVLWSGGVDAIAGIKGNPDYPIVFKNHITHNVLMAAAALLFALRAMNTSGRGGKVLLWLLATAAAANVLLLIPGRTGQLALIAAIVYLALARQQLRGLAAAGVGLALLAGATWLTSDSVMHKRAVQAWKEASAWQPDKPQAETSSIGLRLEFYRNSLAMIAERPLIGTGTGSFRFAYENKVAGNGMVVADHPHNAFLLLGVELGLIGLAVFIGLLIVQWRSAGGMADFADRAAARGLIVIFVVAGMASTTFTDHAEGLFFVWASALLFTAGVGPERSGTAAAT